MARIEDLIHLRLFAATHKGGKCTGMKMTMEILPTRPVHAGKGA